MSVAERKALIYFVIRPLGLAPPWSYRRVDERMAVALCRAACMHGAWLEGGRECTLVHGRCEVPEQPLSACLPEEDDPVWQLVVILLRETPAGGHGQFSTHSCKQCGYGQDGGSMSSLMRWCTCFGCRPLVSSPPAAIALEHRPLAEIGTDEELVCSSARLHPVDAACRSRAASFVIAYTNAGQASSALQESQQ